ncbi:MAG: ComF family protein [Defluviitaleaceae bacterium]|nr:ComF family protein [Defluviitaleaceae bacterium]
MNFLDWFYPPACMGCRTLLPLSDKRRCAVWLCTECEALIEPSEGGLQAHAARYPKTVHFTQNDSAFAYDGILRDIIRDVKFRNKKNHARALGRLWADILKKRISFTDVTLVPVPLHPKKERGRGFNQAEILARELSKGLNLPVQNTLIRVTDTLPQAGLPPAQRIENVADAFRIAPRYNIRGKSYIMVDDIFTTGASLNECARTLLDGGAREVACLTLSVSLKKEDGV